jgi:hypothetical protein
MADRLADRLARSRRRLFVGRESERQMFLSALTADDLPFQVLHVYGPGGIGKTALMREYASLAAEHGLVVTEVDGRNIELSPEAVLNALRAVLGVPSASSPLPALSRDPRRHVILIDTYEMLEPIDAWLHESFFPELSDNILIVVAGRNPPSASARADVGWQSLIRVISLRNLNSEEGRAFLSNRSVPGEQQQAVLDFTHGHPLALSLVADVFAQRRDWTFAPQDAPDIVKILLETFVQRVPGPAHRAVLEACALARVTTEALLGEMLKLPTAAGETTQGVHELFEWLRNLSFMEAGAHGIYPHDLARDALAADLRWRNPDWYKELHNRARAYYTSHLRSNSIKEQQQTLFDYVFLHRDNPVMRSMFEWQAAGIFPDAAHADERSALLKLVQEQEGAESAKLAAMWLDRQPEGLTTYRDQRGGLAGLFFIIEMQRAQPEDIESDPATRAAWVYLLQHAPLRSGEGAAHYRFWMARDSYQGVSAVQTQVFLSTVRYQLTSPGLAYHFLPCADPDFWAPALTYGDLTRLPEADYIVGGRKYGVFAHDWRVRPPLAWLALLADREVDGAALPAASPEPLIVLSRDDFSAAVREALNRYSQTQLLQNNPLLRSRLVRDRVGPSANSAERAEMLQAILREAAETLRQTPRDTKLYRALYHSYFQPAGSQEQAAEAADVPFSTFRRHLKAGLTRLIDTLWQSEIGAGER